MSYKGVVFNIQRFSTDDGDGIRTTVFLKGCPLRCVWCHNSESLSRKIELAFYESACIGCGACAALCQSGAISIGMVAEVNRDLCRICLKCTEVCNTEALVALGEYMTVDEVMEKVLRDKPFFKNGGGVTISGGEPMAQAEFTIALARAARAVGITVALETSGFGRKEDFEALLPYCDLFLFDCKASGERHFELTGVTDTKILENLALLSRLGARIRLRCPIVVGANLDDAFISKIINLAREYDGIEAVELMPYHKTGVDKPVSLGGARQPEFTVPSDDTLGLLAEKIERESGKRAFY